MDANIAAVICAAIAMIGTAIGAFFQYRSTIKQKKDELEAKNAKELEEAKKKIEESEKAEADRALRDEIQRMTSEVTSSVQAVARDVSDMQKHVKGIDERMDKLSKTMERRMSTHDERMRAIVEVLSKNARTFSALIRAQKQTDTRLQTIMEVESYNLKFSQQTAGALAVVGEVLAERIEVAGATETDMFRLREALKTANAAHSGFTDKILNAQVSFVTQDPASAQQDTAGDAEVKAIQSIMHNNELRKGSDDEESSDNPS